MYITQKTPASFKFQISAMKFTSLTAVIVFTTAMVSVVIASAGPDLSCEPYQGGCSKGVKSFNNDNDFGYLCGANGHITRWFPCTCKGCCRLYDDGGGLNLPTCSQ
ncbi:uncharacterized protein F5147DRAFT_725126 [Suillus discolor]|uniref:Uncharacterized protein n=1 Tax=Suillus discolor TaxID=1912936 RepID=A0A9P7EUM3_9AGAM|nr:uncharacterized protein F5147DRAFT_725126 [Suillus discolor]KAG2090128.1 hypothetical protein F5147DRAFT_725126 [Suillus discolor]